jgi:hypothetical protein
VRLEKYYCTIPGSESRQATKAREQRFFGSFFKKEHFLPFSPAL